MTGTQWVLSACSCPPPLPLSPFPFLWLHCLQDEAVTSGTCQHLRSYSPSPLSSAVTEHCRCSCPCIWLPSFFPKCATVPGLLSLVWIPAATARLPWGGSVLSGKMLFCQLMGFVSFGYISTLLPPTQTSPGVLPSSGLQTLQGISSTWQQPPRVPS